MLDCAWSIPVIHTIRNAIAHFRQDGKRKFAEHSGAKNGLSRLMKGLNVGREQAVGYLRRFELRKLLEVQVGDEQFEVKDGVRALLENPNLIMAR